MGVKTIAQLIKLKDYISRYEWNAYRYPTQYMRLKQDNWNKLCQRWDTPVDEPNNKHQKVSEEADSMFSKWKAFISRKPGRKVEGKVVEADMLPTNEMELKQYFLNKLFPLQLKWASSTVTDVSLLAERYEEDRLLKYFLQRFPDTYLMMYYPVFSIQKAPVEGEIIFISPIGVEIIYVIEESPGATIMASDERTWNIDTGNVPTRILSPLIALKRTEQIVKSIFRKSKIDLPVIKVVLSGSNHIQFSTEPFNTKIIGKNEYDNWFHDKRKLVSPLKSRQLKAAEVLLNHCQTTAVKRPEWDEEINPFPIGTGK